MVTQNCAAREGPARALYGDQGGGQYRPLDLTVVLRECGISGGCASNQPFETTGMGSPVGSRRTPGYPTRWLDLAAALECESLRVIEREHAFGPLAETFHTVAAVALSTKDEHLAARPGGGREGITRARRHQSSDLLWQALGRG